MKKFNYTVLYAEDEVSIRKNITQFLSYSFENIIEASDGEIAYKLYREHKPDLIITDIKMPKMDGFEFIQKVREQNSEIPIIVISAHSEKGKLFKAIKLNLVDYIIKPIQRTDLKDALDDAVNKLTANKYCLLDTLTSLPTRSILEVEFNNIMQRYEDKKENAGAIFVDIDNFKSINDTFGHQFGDKVIKKISNTLISGVRKDDLVIRWGGDEFLILLVDSSLSQIKKIAQHLRTEVNKIEIDGCKSITCSFGIDTIKNDDTIDKIISRIDKALLSAKRNFKNTVIEYSELDICD